MAISSNNILRFLPCNISMEHKISVIVPVYNIPTSYLCACIDSILVQDYSNLEIIIINDCSPLADNDSIIRDYCKKDNRIVYEYLRKNGGVSNARNIGLAKATGDFVTFVDSDDFLPQNSISSMYDEIESTKSDIVMSGMSFEQDSSGCNIINDSQPYTHQVGEETEEYLLNTIGRFRMSFWGKLYRKHLLSDIRFPVGIAYFEDYTLLWQLAKKYPTYSVIPTVGYIAKYRAGSASRANVDIVKCQRLITSLTHSVDQINNIFPNQIGVRRKLASFVICESFAYKYMFSNLSRIERENIFPQVRNLYLKIKSSCLVSVLMVAAMKMRLMQLHHPLIPDNIVYIVTRIIYRLKI